MEKNKNKILQAFKKLFSTGFFHIFGASVLVKIIGFCSGIFVVRLLSKSDYGVYGYVNNLIGIFLILDGLGTISGLLQYSSEYKDDPAKACAFEVFGFKIGMFFDGLIAIVLFLVGMFVNFKIDKADNLLIILSAQPMMMFLISYIAILLRVRFKNKTFSLFNIISSGISLIALVVGSLIGGLYGMGIFIIVGNAIICIIGILIVRGILLAFKTRSKLTSAEKKSFLKLSIICAISNASSHLLYLLDVFIIGIVIPNEEVIAAYKTATTIPFALTFIPSAIITYAYPYFAAHCKERCWTKKNFGIMIVALAIISAIITLVGIIFAPFIIKLFFGKAYNDSVLPFRVLMLNFFFTAVFRIPAGNLLVTQKKINFNLIMSLIEGAINIILDVVLILLLGSIGAAITTIGVTVISGVTSTIYYIIIINRKNKPNRKNKTPIELEEISKVNNLEYDKIKETM